MRLKVAGTGKTKHYPTKKKNGIQRAAKKAANNYDSEFDGRLKYLDSYSNAEPSGAFWSSENQAYMDIQTIKSLFQSEDSVFLTVDAIAQPISTLPLRVFKVAYRDGKEIKEVDMSHPLNKLLQKPNKLSTSSEVIYNLVADYTLAGNNFAWKGDAGNLYQLPAENIIYDFDKQGLPNGYFVASNFDNGIPNIQFRADLKDIGHAKRPNPSSAIYGLSPFAPAKRPILFNRYSQEYLNNFYLKGATPQIMLELGDNANEKSVSRLLSSFEQAYTGRRNQRRTVILPKGVSSQVVETKIADQELKELIMDMFDRILAVLKVPKHLVGLQESGSLGSQETKSIMAYFWQTVITDTATAAISQPLTDLYAKELGEDYVIDFDYSQVPELKDDEQAKADLSNSLQGIMTVNEIREKYWDLPPIDGGDTIAPPGFSQFASSFAQPGQQETEKKNVKSTEEAKPAEAEEAEKITLEVEEKKSPDRYAAAMDNFLFQLTETIKIVRKLNKKTKAATDAFNADPGSVYDALMASYDSFEDQYTSTFNEQLQSVSDIGYDQQLVLVDSSIDTNALRAAKQRDESGRHAMLAARGLESFKMIRETTLDQVMSRITEGLEKELTLGEVENSIRKYMQANAANRAGTIARTETLQALTVGQESVFNQARDAGIDFEKTWITAGDGRVRDAHAGVNGMTVDDKEPFVVAGEELMHPRDPKGSAANTINCRCTVIMKPKKKEED